ncbi:MAG: adenylyl-sulfate kinase, partial [Nitrososphaerota archaeon]|nr:adenylyl-sulfate kinase [Nitrososphaerota archaeon]
MQLMDGSRPGGQGPVGFTVWMTGLPGSGKSTLARLLEARLREAHGRYVEVLDGDEVRRGLSRDLGLSKEHREEHARRVSYVAKVLSRNGVVAVVAIVVAAVLGRRAGRRGLQQRLTALASRLGVTPTDENGVEGVLL